MTELLREAAIPIAFVVAFVTGWFLARRNGGARREAEPDEIDRARLIETEHRLQAAVDVSQIGIFDHDHVLDTIYQSPQQRQTHGWTTDEPVSPQDFLALVHPKDVARIESAVQKAHDPLGEGIFDVEHRIVRRDGHVRWLKNRAQTFFEGEGGTRRPVRTIGASIDTTNRRKIEDAHRKLASIIEASGDFIAYSDLEGRVLYLNAAGARLVGLDRADDALKKHASEFVTETEAARLEVEVVPALKETGTWRGEFAVRHFKAGTAVPVEMNAFVIRDEGSGAPIAVATISRDISDRKLDEADRERLILELEARNSELERFTYTVSHDLKGPLITIKGFLGYLVKDAVDGDVERMKADVARITAATSRMDRLLRELLELSRVGHVLNAPEPVEMQDIVQEAVERVRGRLSQQGVKVKVAPGLPRAFGDRVRLVEVVQNLLDNAAKFMGAQEDPEIVVGCRGLDAPSLSVFYIKDNGIGIDPAYREKVFGLFDKLDRQSEGTGIGLALVKRIVQVHGGRVWIEAPEGTQVGTTVCFSLPEPPVL